jgi:hypothetical protein
MRISSTDKRMWEYEVGEAIEVDVSYQSPTGRSRPARLADGIVKVDTAQPLTVMVGRGEKVHAASGLQVTIDAPGKNFGGDTWFGIRPRCQEYRGKKHNWMQVSSARVIEGATVTCSKCQK